MCGVKEDKGLSGILFLDDDPARHLLFLRHHPDAVTVATVEEAIVALTQAPYDQVHLDHDLGGTIYADSRRTDTGMEVVRWIVANRPSIGEVIVHTLNARAAEGMISALRSAGYRSTYRPFDLT